jgi:hypothetical protein
VYSLRIKNKTTRFCLPITLQLLKFRCFRGQDSTRFIQACQGISIKLPMLPFGLHRLHFVLGPSCCKPLTLLDFNGFAFRRNLSANWFVILHLFLFLVKGFLGLIFRVFFNPICSLFPWAVLYSVFVICRFRRDFLELNNGRNSTALTGYVKGFARQLWKLV